MANLIAQFLTGALAAVLVLLIIRHSLKDRRAQRALIKVTEYNRSWRLWQQILYNAVPIFLLITFPGVGTLAFLVMLYATNAYVTKHVCLDVEGEIAEEANWDEILPTPDKFPPGELPDWQDNLQRKLPDQK